MVIEQCWVILTFIDVILLLLLVGLGTHHFYHYAMRTMYVFISRRTMHSTAHVMCARSWLRLSFCASKIRYCWAVKNFMLIHLLCSTYILLCPKKIVMHILMLLVYHRHFNQNGFNYYNYIGRTSCTWLSIKLIPWTILWLVGCVVSATNQSCWSDDNHDRWI